MHATNCRKPFTNTYAALVFLLTINTQPVFLSLTTQQSNSQKESIYHFKDAESIKKISINANNGSHNFVLSSEFKHQIKTNKNERIDFVLPDNQTKVGWNHVKQQTGSGTGICILSLIPMRSSKQSSYKLVNKPRRGWLLNADEYHELNLVSHTNCNKDQTISTINSVIESRRVVSIAFSTDPNSCSSRYISHVIDVIDFSFGNVASTTVHLPFNTRPYFLCARLFDVSRVTVSYLPVSSTVSFNASMHAKRSIDNHSEHYKTNKQYPDKVTQATVENDDDHNNRFFLKAAAKWIHQGNSSTTMISTIRPIMPHWLMFCVIGVLLTVSGLFSGLNLGLMSLTPQDLDIIIAAEEDSKIVGYARRIMPLRRRGNFLLCTILLGNVLVNATATVLLEEIIDGILAVVGSTIGIVIFGEIIPQAICSRKGLVVGAKTVGLTKLFMILTFVISYPLSKILDFALGPDVGSSYTRRQILELVKRTTKDIEQHEMAIVAGALALKSKVVRDLMTSLSDVFMLEATRTVNSDLMIEIYKEGYTRIPVFLESRQNVIGLINIRDFAFIDLEGKMSVSNVCAYFKHPVGHVDANSNIFNLLEEFKKGNYHIALVEQSASDSGDKLIGIITLEDIVEEIIQSQIYDEWDNIEKDFHKTQRHKNRAPDFSFFVRPQKDVNSIISVQQKIALFQYLSAVVPPFHPKYISQNVLSKLLNNQFVLVEYKHNKETAATSPPNDEERGDNDKRLSLAMMMMRNDVSLGNNLTGSALQMIKKDRRFKSSKPDINARDVMIASSESLSGQSYIYRYGKLADYFVMIISGKACLETGKEKITSLVGPFSYFGTSALCDEDEDIDSISKASNVKPKAFVPDFSLKLIQDSTYIRVTRAVWVSAVRASAFESRQLSFVNESVSMSANIDGNVTGNNVCTGATLNDFITNEIDGAIEGRKQAELNIKQIAATSIEHQCQQLEHDPFIESYFPVSPQRSETALSNTTTEDNPLLKSDRFDTVKVGRKT